MRDVIGKSFGFRRPGYGLSVDPGTLYARAVHLERGVPARAEEDSDSGQEREDEFEHASLVTWGSFVLAAPAAQGGSS